MTGQLHQADPRVLNRRTLHRDHRHLLGLLRPGLSVLDVGCGTGAITAGIAAIVAPDGAVIGVDRDEALLAIARQQYQAVTNLRFENVDVLSLQHSGKFDIITAARTLQWVSNPREAIIRMSNAVVQGGHIAVLDYNHEKNSWEPEPPTAFTHFYQSFLNWRSANRWDNRIADHLVDLFQFAGITEIQVHDSDETAARGGAEFTESTAIWTHVIETLGPRIVEDGWLNEPERLEAEDCYRNWTQNSLERQTLSMKTVVGRIP